MVRTLLFRMFRWFYLIHAIQPMESSHSGVYKRVCLRCRLLLECNERLLELKNCCKNKHGCEGKKKWGKFWYRDAVCFWYLVTVKMSSHQQYLKLSIDVRWSIPLLCIDRLLLVATRYTEDSQWNENCAKLEGYPPHGILVIHGGYPMSISLLALWKSKVWAPMHDNGLMRSIMW